MAKDELNCMVLGIILGIVCGGLISKLSPYSAESKQETLIQACEENLPRNQSCRIIAVPERTEK